MSAKRKKPPKRPPMERDLKVGEFLVLVRADVGGEGRLDARHRLTLAKAQVTATELQERGYDPVTVTIGSIVP